MPCLNQAALFVLVCAALAACTEESGRLSVEEGLKCANEGFEGHPGTFSLGENAIAYSYESSNGPAKVIVRSMGGAGLSEHSSRALPSAVIKS